MMVNGEGGADSFIVDRNCLKTDQWVDFMIMSRSFGPIRGLFTGICSGAGWEVLLPSATHLLLNGLCASWEAELSQLCEHAEASIPTNADVAS